MVLKGVPLTLLFVLEILCVLNQFGQYESEDEHENDDNNPKPETRNPNPKPEIRNSDEGIEYEHGESLIARRTLHAKLAPCEDNQRENLFHTRYLIKGKVRNMIIDGISCCNIASTDLINKLQITTIYHPRPYKLHWMNDCGELKVNRQA